LLALELKERLDATDERAREPIAVVGLGCRFTVAESPDAFARLLDDGGDAIREIPRDRWDIDAYFDSDPDVPGKINTRYGGFIDGIDSFDPAHFGISPREAAGMDPQQRLVLEVAWEALEHAGLAPDRLAGSQTGVFLGIATLDYASLVMQGGERSDLLVRALARRRRRTSRTRAGRCRWTRPAHRPGRGASRLPEPAQRGMRHGTGRRRERHLCA
jgi:3-oxoacyl-(acyl-carrier-protein) synthase